MINGTISKRQLISLYKHLPKYPRTEMAPPVQVAGAIPVIS